MSKRPNGSAYRMFLELAALETDDCVIWPYSTAGQRGYGQVNASAAGGPRFYTHRRALELREPQPQDKPYALHGPCNEPRCMNYRHLRWGTPTENCMDKRRDGTAQIGVLNHHARLTEADVQHIRQAYMNGTPQRRLAAAYGVAVMTINRAIRGESWSHV